MRKLCGVFQLYYNARRQGIQKITLALFIYIYIKQYQTKQCINVS